ncbi:MAG: polysaccharide deacetylase [Roseibacillus sp.]|nr:polysaccharide deacetylase [Roseibacillus sp.]HCQ37702.1 polysaccharide deacetylase family protein [Verrucomicrobiales bacterium]
MSFRLLTLAPLLALVACFSSSCSSLESEGEKPSTMANNGYRSPYQAWPSARNPNLSLSSQFPKSIGITHSRGLGHQPYIAMTFDDGPHASNTPRLLDILRQRNIKATFYVIGKNVDNYPHLTRRIVAEGHEIGNHTYTHRNLKKLSDAQVLSEMSRARSSIVNATGVQPRTMRPPYGAIYQRQRELIMNRFGYPTIMWAVDPRDWQRPGISVVKNRILTKTTNGSIVLAHDLHAPTVAAMPATLDGLLAKGFKFVTVSQLLSQKALYE